MKVESVSYNKDEIKITNRQAPLMYGLSLLESRTSDNKPVTVSFDRESICLSCDTLHKSITVTDLYDILFNKI